MTRMTAATALAAAFAMTVLGGCSVNVEGTDEAESGANAAVSENAAPAPVEPLVRTANSPSLQWGPCPDIFPQGCELTVLQGDPAKPNSDVMLRVPGGYAIPPHSHTSAERIVLVDGVLEVKYQGAPPALLREGTYAYGPPGLPHSATCRSSGPCVLFIAFVDPVDATAVAGEVE